MAVTVTGKRDLLTALSKFKEEGRKAVQTSIIRTINYSLETVVRRMTELKLVDTGFARNSWKVSFPDEFQGLLSTNCIYIPMLEYGWSVAINGKIKVKAHTRKFKTSKRKAHTRYQTVANKRKRVGSYSDPGLNGNFELSKKGNKTRKRIRVKSAKIKAFTQNVKEHTRAINRKGHFFLRHTVIKSTTFLNRILAEELGKLTNGVN